MTASSQTPHETQIPPPLIHVPAAQALATVRQYDAQTVENIAAAMYEQAKTEDAVELAAACQDRQALDWFHSRWKIAAELCAGRPLEDLLSVGQVLAALDGQMPTTLPLTMTWDGLVADPNGDGPGEATFVACTTSRGGRTVLALDDDQRLALGGQLLATDRLTWACPTTGCGMTADELDGSGPPLFGWIRVQVAGVDGPPRWWCSPGCVHAAIAAAGAELAALDQAAAVDPHEPVPAVPTADTDTMALPAVAEDSGEARCVRCGCTENTACPGGCAWVPAGMVDLCTSCVTPDELAAMGGGQ